VFFPSSSLLIREPASFPLTNIVRSDGIGP
jgi:hypothetical protein